MNTLNKLLPTGLRASVDAAGPGKAGHQVAQDQMGLAQRLGPLQRIGQRMEDSRRARQALGHLREAEVTSVVNVGLTQLALTEGKLRAALVASTVGEIGALTIAVNNQTAGVVLSLTAGAAAEAFAHMDNRKANLDLLAKGQASGAISGEEALGFAEAFKAITEDDIARGLRRAQASKDAVEALADHATQGIAATKERLV